MRVAIAAMLMVVAALLPATGYARNEYYIEVGADEKKDAGEQWKLLVRNHKDLLGKLKYYPKQVMDGDTVIATRIQAGPFASKAKAQKTCTALFEKKIPCFVLEGLSDGPPPSSVISLSDKMSPRTQKVVSLPWLAAEAPPPAPAPEEQSSWVPDMPDMPWDSDKKETKEAKPAEEKPAAGGKVEVAEAIRVPLSDSNEPAPLAVIHDQPVTVESLPQEEVKHHEDLEPPVPAATAASGWINIESFDDEDAATRFWQKVRKKSAAATSSLRVRIVRSLIGRGSNAVLAVGPFAGQYEADSFCHDAIWELDNGLRCSFTDKPQAASAPAPETQAAVASHSDAYAERRKQFRRPINNPGASEPVVLSSRLYWLQVLTAPSEMEALQKWEQVRTDNSDLLEGMRSSVSASLTDKTSYVVRIGPMTDNGKAIALCDKLHERGVQCRVLLFSASH